jgi:hypothetical protein
MIFCQQAFQLALAILPISKDISIAHSLKSVQAPAQILDLAAIREQFTYWAPKVKPLTTLEAAIPSTSSLALTAFFTHPKLGGHWHLQPPPDKTSCQRNTRTRYETYQNNTNLEPSGNVFMGRTVDQDVHAAFVEFRAKGNRAHHCAHLAAADCLTSPTLTCLQRTTSACLCNASIANRSERRILPARSSTCWSAPASQTILMRHVHKQALETGAQLRQMAYMGHRP